jgi:RelA/SpoT family (p)ppGpp synthetase
MRTIESITDDSKKQRIATETMEIYAPLADRMGMNFIRDELEDLSFTQLNPEARNLIVNKLSLNKLNRDNNFKNISAIFERKLQLNNINSKIVGREKTPFSIWRKIQSKRVSLEQLTDVIGFRVIVGNLETCYKVLGIFHANWSSIPGKFKDYISTPKINNYKSLHTAIIGPKNEKVEIQIRTQEMHDFARRGIASHWLYKSSEKINLPALKEYNWLRDLVEIIEKGTTPEDYFEYTKLQMFQENVFCFTPDGEVIKLPKNASPIDFAYAVHTKVGDSAIDCEINGKQSPLQSILNNGDLVKIIVSKKVSPSLHWLSLTKTGKARAAIRRYWHNKTLLNIKTDKNYFTGLCIQIPNEPGRLGEVSSLIGINHCNIVNMEIVAKKTNYLEFIFDIQVKDLKKYANLVSELKFKSYKFKIIRHRKKDALLQRIFKNFKRN